MTVKAMRPTLSPDDINRLVNGATSEDRAHAAHKVCRRIASEDLSEADRAYADQILGMLAKDTAELVRRAMAVTLRNSPKLPRDVALQLAQDVETVALPVIEGSPVFTNADLAEIVLNATDTKQVSVARRSSVDGEISDLIAERGCRDAVKAVAGNNGAQLGDRAYGFMLGRFQSDAEIHEAIIERDIIPPHVAEKMVSLVSGHMFDILVNKHELPPQLAIDLASGAQERVTIDLVEQAARSTDIPRFVQQLHLNGRLNASLIMRAMCMGHMTFVEWSLAELAGIAHSRAWLMIHDAGSLGLKTLFDHAGLPSRMLTAFKAAIRVYHETDYDGRGAGEAERFRSKMIERVLTQFQAIPKADLDYLLDRLDAYAGYRDGEFARYSDQASAERASA